MSRLDRARANARSNMRYLRDEAGDGTNFRANVRTMKRLFFGTKDVDGVVVASSGQLQVRPGGGGEVGNIDWERAPSEVASNLRRNLSSFRNWVHDVTDGRIPASSSTGGGGTGGGGGSVATRMRAFHEMKQKGSGALVMDNWWIGKNVAVALLPGLLVHLYFWYLQDEMREYYSGAERMERERIMGTTMVDADGDSPSNKDGEDGGRNEGIYSALIPGGDGVWDRLRTVVEDLFLGGAERRISELKVARGRATEDDDEASDRHATTPAHSPPNRTGAEISPSTGGGRPIPASSSSVDVDPDVRLLIERVQALERQLGIGVDGGTSSSEKKLRRRVSAEEARREEHEMKRKVERMRQSPIRNRREDSLEARWRNEARSGNEQNDDLRVIDGDDASDRSYSRYFAKLLSMEVFHKTIKEIGSIIGLSEEAPADAERDVQGHAGVDSSHSSTGDDIIAAADSNPNSAAMQNLPSARVISESIPEVMIAPATSSSVDDADEPSDDARRGGRIHHWAVNTLRLLRTPSRPGAE